MKIEILSTSEERKMYYWRLKAKNGEILAHSEQYTTKAKALKTAKAILAEISKITIVDKTKENHERTPQPS